MSPFRIPNRKFGLSIRGKIRFPAYTERVSTNSMQQPAQLV